VKVFVYFKAQSQRNALVLASLKALQRRALDELSCSMMIMQRIEDPDSESKRASALDTWMEVYEFKATRLDSLEFELLNSFWLGSLDECGVTQQVVGSRHIERFQACV
jgi:Domain of unknown function (DUF4936)